MGGDCEQQLPVASAPSHCQHLSLPPCLPPSHAHVHALTPAHPSNHLHTRPRHGLQPRLRTVYMDAHPPGGGLLAHLEFSFPRALVHHTGAPRRMWAVLCAPAGSEELAHTVLWQGKPPTRLPEALWLRLVPGAGVVDESSWRMHKLGSPIDPLQVRGEGGWEDV